MTAETAEGALVGPVPRDKLCPFQRFVDEEGDGQDLLGYVAYALYKRDKLEFVASHLDSSKDAEWKDTSLEAFTATALLPARVEGYRTQATELLQQFSDRALARDAEEVEERFKTELVEKLQKAHPFWASVWMTRWTKLQKPAASLAVVLLLCNIGLLTYSLNLTDDAVMYLAQIVQKLLFRGM